MQLLAELLSRMVDEDILTNIERRTSVDEMARKAGIVASPLCYEALTHAITNVTNNVY